jgi:hypothetical protein
MYLSLPSIDVRICPAERAVSADIAHKMRRVAIVGLTFVFALATIGGLARAQATNVVASVLPASRSVPVGQRASAFATIINTGSATATGCAIAPTTAALSATAPIAFDYQATSASTNALIGTPNAPVAIAPGAAQTFIFGVTPTASFSPTDITLSFHCNNAEDAPVTTGLNTLLVSGGSAPDIVALSATISNNGIANLSAASGTGVFSVATINLGASGGITATADTGAAPLPVTILLCQTNPASGACLAPAAASAVSTMGTGSTQTFGVFVSASAPVPLDPVHHRVIVRFKDSSGATVGATSVAIQNSTYQGPLTINQGGTYSGNWESQNASVPAVSINTTAPVIIQNCFIRGKSDLIRTNVDNANVTVRNCHGYGLDPDVAGQMRGYFFRSTKIASLTAEHNYIEGTSFGFNNWGNMQSSAAIGIRYNKVYNLDGVPSDGKGGRILTGLQFGQDNGNHFVILDSMQGLANAEIAWNEIKIDPYTASLGDIINIYRSSGTASSPIQIHDNYMFGGYSAIPNAAGDCCGPNANTSEGIAIDGSGDDTAKTTSAFVRMVNNQIVNQGGAQGLGINVGHDNEAYGNHIVSTGTLSNGVWMAATYSNALTVGNFVYNQPANVFFNNSAHDNSVGWEIELAAPNNQYARIGPPQRSDLHLVNCSGNCGNNISLPGPITNATQDNETALWRQKLSTNNISVGPLP